MAELTDHQRRIARRMARDDAWLWPSLHRRRRRYRLGRSGRRILPKTAAALIRAGLAVRHHAYAGCLVPTMTCKLMFDAAPPVPAVPD